MRKSYRSMALMALLSYQADAFSVPTPRSNSWISLNSWTSWNTKTTKNTKNARIPTKLYSDAKSTSGKSTIMSTDEAEYLYDEADFEGYSSDYSDLEPNLDDDTSDTGETSVASMTGDTSNGDDGYNSDDEEFDMREVGMLNFFDESPSSSSSSSSSSSFNLSPFEQHAREVFLTYAEQVRSNIDTDASPASPSNSNSNSQDTTDATHAILQKDLHSMLLRLDISATPTESRTLFHYLDANSDGFVTLEEFLPWYATAIDAAQQSAREFQSLVKSRRTVHKFDATEVDDGVLRRALECAIAAPNRRGTEPWRFIKLGRETVGRVVKLREEMQQKENDGGKHVDGSFVSWTKVPHWIVVTYTRAPPSSGYEGKLQQKEDFKSTCCAVQNFLLSMWSEGIGTKWTDGPIQRTEEFAEICGIDLEREKVAGVIWYGFARGGLKAADPKSRRRGVEEVLDVLP